MEDLFSQQGWLECTMHGMWLWQKYCPPGKWMVNMRQGQSTSYTEDGHPTVTWESLSWVYKATLIIGLMTIPYYMETWDRNVYLMTIDQFQWNPLAPDILHRRNKKRMLHPWMVSWGVLIVKILNHRGKIAQNQMTLTLHPRWVKRRL